MLHCHSVLGAGSRVMTKRAGNRPSAKASQSKWGERHGRALQSNTGSATAKVRANGLRDRGAGTAHGQVWGGCGEHSPGMLAHAPVGLLRHKKCDVSSIKMGTSSLRTEDPTPTPSPGFLVPSRGPAVSGPWHSSLRQCYWGTLGIALSHLH